MSLTGKPSYQTRRLGGDAIISDDAGVSEFSAWSSAKTAEEIANSGATVIDDTTYALDKTYSSSYLESRLAAVVPSPDRVVQCADPSATLRSILVCDDVGALLSTWSDAKIGTDGSLILADGAGLPSAPCIKFDGDATTGLFLAGASSLGVAADGATVATFAPSGLSVPALTATTATINGGSIDSAVIGSGTRAAGSFTTLSSNSTTTLGATTATSLSVSGVTALSAGTVATPSLHFGDAGTGLWRLGPNAIGVTVNGVSIGVFNTSGLNQMAIGAGNRSTGAFTTLSSNAATTLGATSATSIDSTPIGATTASTGSFTTLTTSSTATIPAGAVATPSLTFSTSTNSGLYLPAVGAVGVAAGGTAAGQFTSTGLNACALGATTRAAVSGTTGNFNSTLTVTGATTLNSTLAVTGQSTMQLGTVSAPSLRPTGATTTGLYWPSTTSAAVAVAGVQRALVDANGITSSGYSVDGVTRFTTGTGGTFTPTATDTSGVQPTYLAQTGNWQQWGRVATAFIYLQVNAITAPLGTDQIRVTLPFTASVAGCVGTANLSLATAPANVIGVCFRIVPSTNYGVIEWIRTAGLSSTPVLWNQWTATGFVSIQVTAYI